MKYSDLNNFTHDELSNFTHSELSIDIPELLALVRADNRSLPVSTCESLVKLYAEIENLCKNDTEPSVKKLSFPSLSKTANFLDNIRKIIIFLDTVYKLTKNIEIQQYIEKFLKFLLDIFQN